MQRKTYEEVKELFVKAYHSQQWGEAITWTTVLLEKYENRLKSEGCLSRIWDNRGVCILQMRHWWDALLNFDKALETETDPDMIARIYCNKGAAYFDMGNLDKALENLQTSIDIEEIPQTLLTLGNIFIYKGEVEKALSYYERCIKSDPDYADG